VTRTRLGHLGIAAAATLALALIGLSGCTAEKGDPGDSGETGETGPPGPEGPPGGLDPTTSVETCISCHGEGGELPVGDIDDPMDAHYIDVTDDGRLTLSGLRRMDATIKRVDVTGSVVEIDFDVLDENGAAVGILIASDGRFAIDRLDPAVDGDSSRWVNLGSRASSTERFTDGTFDQPSVGSYTYVSVFDPSAVVQPGDPLRVSIQLSSDDLPAENAWCDFDAPTTDCSGASLTRDIVQTVDCNDCHGPTPDTRLAYHSGGRTEVEFCVACHNPGLGDEGSADMTVMIHGIHAGKNRQTPRPGYEHVSFTRDLDECASCHTGGVADESNWAEFPTQEACGSCHDSVNFATGEGHGSGGRQTSNETCVDCHPSTGERTAQQLPVPTVHHGAKRNAEAEKYRGFGNGFIIESLTHDAATGQLRVVYGVGNSGSLMDLTTREEWTHGGSLALRVGWDTFEYTNEESGSTPAQPTRLDALDICDDGCVARALGVGRYEAVFDVPDGAMNTLTVHMEGRPTADLDDRAAVDSGDRIPVASAFADVDVEGDRAVTLARRVSVDSTSCNGCHDSAGAGLSIHGANRVAEMRVCAVCHNPDATDINQRPASPSATPDGKREETIDFKRMVHQIHSGKHLQNGLYIYGFGNSLHDFSHVGFTGNLANCKTCHDELTYPADGDISAYSTEAAALTLATSVDTGAAAGDPSDDLNISAITSICSSCHDDDRAREHMVRRGGSFKALDADIH